MSLMSRIPSGIAQGEQLLALGRIWPAVLAAATLGALAAVPFVGSSYHLALAISVLSYLVLATAWAMFSGPTRYISLATAAFFGIGAYTVAVLGELLPWPVVLAAAAVVGTAVALLCGLSTLRLSGIYFVIFSFGLTELFASWSRGTKSTSTARSADTSFSTSPSTASSSSSLPSQCSSSWSGG